MRSKSYRSLIVILLAAVIAATNFGCGGSSASPPPPPPPPAISVSMSQATATVQAGATTQFSATVTNDSANKGVTWTVSCPVPPCGTVSPTATSSGGTVTYTAPGTPPAFVFNATITATSVSNPSVFASATVNVPEIIVSVTPGPTTVLAGSTAQFTATVTNDPPNKGVTWAVSCSASPCGTILPGATASGAATTYIAPAAPPASDLRVTITVTCVDNPSEYENMIMTVPAIKISVAPAGALLPVNTTQQFRAAVQNDPANAGVTWTLAQNGAACTTPACGVLSSGTTNPATYTAPATVPSPAPVTLTATSVTDASKSAVATLNLTNGSVEIIPDSIDFGRAVVHGTTAPEMVTVTNTTSTALNVNGVTITGTNAGDFSETNTCNSSVGAGISCTISVTFTPASTGTRSAEVSVSDTSKDSPQQVNLSGTGYTNSKFIASAHSAMTGTTVTAAPSPTGPYSVGTRVLALTDSMRNDPYLTNGTKRELAVRLWYPASLTRNCKLAEYTSPAVWNRFSQLAGIRLPHVRTNSCLNASMTDGMHPVVVFTPGYTGTFTDYTFLFEDLASRGYVVASVAHTYETTAVELPDRGLVQGLLGSHLDASWRGDEQIFSFATSVRLQDLTFVLNELQLLSSDAASPLGNKLDMSRVAIAGHSMGGSTAILAIGEEPRFKAAVVIDGVLAHALNSSTETPVLLLTAGHEQWSYTERRVWEQLQGPRLIVNLKGAEHVTPSDEVWLIKDAIMTGSMGPERAIAAIRDYTAAFLDKNLLGKPLDPLLAGTSSEYPDAEITTQNELLRGKP